MKLLPFEIETIDGMRHRWRYACDVTYELKQVETGVQINPCLQRRHVFDFAGGIRMVASVELAGAPKPELHLSFGVHESFHQEWMPRGQQAWLDRCHRIVEELRVVHMVTTQQTSKFLTKRAYHLWFATTH